MTGFLLPPEAEPAPARACGSPASKLILLRTLALVTVLGLLAACSGSSSSKSPSSNNGNTGGSRTLSGFVGSPSLTDATVTLLLEGGNTTVSARSGDNARYSLTLDKSVAVPLHVQVEGGMDLLTGETNETVLSALSFDEDGSALSVTHLSTLAAEMAACAGAPTSASLNTSWQRIRQRTGMTGDSSSPSPSTAELAALMRANLSLAEAVDRTREAMAAVEPVTGEGVLAGIACDLFDDGHLNLSEPGTSARLINVFRAAESGVLLELIADDPYLDGAPAASRINDVLRQISNDPAADLGSIAAPAAMIGQAERDLALLRTEFSDPELMDLLISLFAGDPQTSVADALTAARHTTLWGLPERVALADSSSIDTLAAQAAAQTSAQAPLISLSADPETVSLNERSRLSWAAGNADACVASGDWSGNRAAQGSANSASLNRSSEFTLHCAGLGGLAEAAVQVAVVDANERPIVSLSADDGTLTAGQSTTIRWSSSNATSCSASGAWSGNRGVVGNRNTGRLYGPTYYTLTCTGPGGSDSATLEITVESAPEPEPVPPSQPAPTLSLSASSSSIVAGGTVRLSWNSSNASSCSASGGWSGSRATSGQENSRTLNSNTSFQLTCSGPGGSVARTVNVTVSSGPAPDVNLSASSTLVNAGGSSTLSWSSSNASSCTASGGWSGSRGTSGSAVVGPLNAQTTFSLSCSGSGGTALDMVAIRVNGTMTLNWVAPTENVDGSQLTDLDGYRVYYGQSSRNYTNMVDVANPAATSINVSLPSGDYYVAMTALDREGNESAYSNEVLKTVP